MLKYIFYIMICQLAGFISSAITKQAVISWYPTIIKSPLSPPSYIFPIAWISLYFLMGVAWAIINNKANKKHILNIKANIFFVIQLLFNSMWSFIFFGMKKPIWAFCDILLIMLFLVITILLFRKISKIASNLLWPYLAWLMFASYLNFYIILHN